MVQGSIPTPFIFDDITRFEDAAEGLMYWYMTDHSIREKYGKVGREWALKEGGINSKNMGQQFIDGMEYVFSNWVKPKQFGLYSVNDYVGNKMTEGHMGFEIPKIDKKTIKNKIDEMSTTIK